MTPDPLGAFTEFTATVGFAANKTTLDVLAGADQTLLARLEKTGDVRKPAAYQLFPGADLARDIAHLTPSGAQDETGAPIGIVNLSDGTKPDADIQPMSGARHGYVQHDPTRWAVVQPGLPRLTGEAADRATKMTFNRITGFLSRQGILVPTPGLVAPMTVHYRAQDSAGFTVTTRMVSWQGRFEVTVADPGVDRRLVLACLTALTALVLWTPRREGISSISPFRR